MSVPFGVRSGQPVSDDDYYVILGVDFHADQETIASAYRNLAKKYHPDKNNKDERSRKEAYIIFEKIKTAYDVLSDPRKRNIYNTLGPDGLKMDGWSLVNKQLTAEEIREEFLRLQKQHLDNKLAIIAKPRAAFTLSLDASDMFNRQYSTSDDEQYEDELEEQSYLPNIEISSMAASMSVENYLAKDHSLTLTGNLNVKNGVGDGLAGANYKYKYSQKTNYEFLFQSGNGPIASTGVTHKLNDKTSFAVRGFLIFHPYGLVPGAKLTLVHLIRKNLTGSINYKEGINSSVATTLMYHNEKLLFDLTTTYKLSHLHQTVSAEFGHTFNSNRSKLSVTLTANSQNGLSVDYGCETRVMEINVIGASVSLSLPSGVTLKLRYIRANQEFSLPIYLSDEVHSAPVFYGTMIPLVAYFILDRYYLKQVRLSAE